MGYYEPSISEEIKIQMDIDKVLVNVKQKYDINIDYTWGYNKTIEEQCFDILDNIEFNEKNIEIICKPFCKDGEFESNGFENPPKYINNYNDLVKFISNQTYPIDSALSLVNRDFGSIGNKIFDGGYWIYSDGEECELHIVSEKQLNDYIKVCIEYTPFEKIKMLEKLKILYGC